MNALKLYTKHFIAATAHEAICADLKKQAIRELRKIAGGTSVDGVDLAVVNRLKRTYAADIQACLDKLDQKIDDQKNIAAEAGKVRISIASTTIKGTIPKTAKKQILGTVRDYKNYFKIK